MIFHIAIYTFIRLFNPLWVFGTLEYVPVHKLEGDRGTNPSHVAICIYDLCPANGVLLSCTVRRRLGEIVAKNEFSTVMFFIYLSQKPQRDPE